MLEFSSTIFSLGKTGVRSSKCGRLFDAPGSIPLTALTYRRAPNLSPARGFLVMPRILSPVLRPNLLIWLFETYMSLFDVRKLSNLRNPNPSSAISRIPSTSGLSSSFSFAVSSSALSAASAGSASVISDTAASVTVTSSASASSIAVSAAAVTALAASCSAGSAFFFTALRLTGFFSIVFFSSDIEHVLLF